jgi:hypothetical protein
MARWPLFPRETHSPRTAISNSFSRVGLAITSTVAIFPFAIEKRSTLSKCPCGAQTSPTSPLTSIGRMSPASCCENAIAPFAQFLAPRISLGAPERAAASSILTTTSGSSTAISPSKSPERTAARKASATCRCSVRLPDEQCREKFAICRHCRR